MAHVRLDIQLALSDTFQLKAVNVRPQGECATRGRSDTESSCTHERIIRDFARLQLRHVCHDRGDLRVQRGDTNVRPSLERIPMHDLTVALTDKDTKRHFDQRHFAVREQRIHGVILDERVSDLGILHCRPSAVGQYVKVVDFVELLLGSQ